MTMRLCAPVLILTLALGAAAARADEVNIYHGVVDGGSYSTTSTDLGKRPTYLIVDHTSFELALVTYDPKQRTHYETTEATTFDAIRPNAPVGASSQAFIYSGAPQAGSTPVAVRRLRSAGKLSMQPISSTATKLLPKKLAYASYFVALAAYNSEESATFKYQKRLTIASNDANLDLAGAIALVLDDLRDRNVID
jgi:hypothetical protein